MPRKKIDKLVEHAKGCGAKGLAYLCINEDGTYKSSFAKFMTEAELDALVAKMAESREIYFCLQQTRIRSYGKYLARFVSSLEKSLA